VQCVMCAVYGVGRIWCVWGRVCAVYGGAGGVVCGVCSGYDGCRVTGVQCTINMASGVCSVWWVQRRVCAVYGVCRVWGVQCMEARWV
jgi:hypothetical protein